MRALQLTQFNTNPGEFQIEDRRITTSTSASVLAINRGFSASSAMDLPKQPITLRAEQVEELNRKLSTMRHDINNMLSLMIAAVELIRSKPHMTERLVATLLEQPARIS